MATAERNPPRAVACGHGGPAGSHSRAFNPGSRGTVIMPLHVDPTEPLPMQFNIFIERPGAHLAGWPGKNSMGTGLVGRLALASGAGTCVITSNVDALENASLTAPIDASIAGTRRVSPPACGSPWSDAQYKPVRAAGSAASSIGCLSPKRDSPSLDRRSEGDRCACDWRVSSGCGSGGSRHRCRTGAPPAAPTGCGRRWGMRACLHRRAPDK